MSNIHSQGIKWTFFKIASHLKMVTRVGLVKDQCCNSVPGLTRIPAEINLVNDHWLAKHKTIAKNNHFYIMNFLQDLRPCHISLGSFLTGMLNSLCCIDIGSPWSRTIFSSWAPNSLRFKSIQVDFSQDSSYFNFRNWLMSDVKKDTRNVGGWWCLRILKSILSICSNLNQSNISNLLRFFEFLVV